MPGVTSDPLAIPWPSLDDVPANIETAVKPTAERVAKVLGGTRPLQAVQVGSVGQLGQIRAGRQLESSDFTNLGLGAPLGLWSLSDLTNKGTDARSLTNKGAVPFGTGVNGLASEAAVFAGSTGQALYIPDSGVADPYRIRTGSWGCWFRTAKRGVSQMALSKMGAAAGQGGWFVQVTTANVVSTAAYYDGTNTAINLSGQADVADDRWHFVVVTFDGSRGRGYVDGALDGSPQVAAGGTIFGSPGPVNIGAQIADATTAAGSPFYGRVDEAFVTSDVLSEDQVRALYCASVPHTLGAVPSAVRLSVRRRRRGGPLAVGDFPAVPRRLYNFTSGAFVNDEGSNSVPVADAAGTVVGVGSGADGARSSSAHFPGGGSGLSATDAGLPAGTAARSYGCWFKTASTAAGMGIVGWGTQGTGDARLVTVITTGVLQIVSGVDIASGPAIADGQWHHVVVVEDNAAADGVKRKLYLDGRLVVGSTVLNAITLAGANRFRVGANPDGTSPFTGQVDGAFVLDYALTAGQVRALYEKGSMAIGPSPKNAGDHIEVLEANRLLSMFDTLEGCDQVDMVVVA